MDRNAAVLPTVFSKKFSDKMKQYRTKFQRLLDLEFDAELMSRTGCVLKGLTLTVKGPVNTGVSIKLSRDGYIPHDSQVGRLDTVVLRNNKHTQSRIEGTVFSVQARDILVVVTEPLPLQLDGHWTLEKLAASFETKSLMELALQVITSSKLEYNANTQVAINKKFQPPSKSAIRSIIIGEEGAIKLAAEPSIMTPLHFAKDFNAGTKSWPLNSSQREIIQHVLRRKLSLIQGPPGTGKTHTGIQLLRFLAPLYAQEKLAILCTAFTNIAVDNLVEGLLDVGVKVIRLGRPEKTRDILYRATLDYQMSQHPKFAELEGMKARRAMRKDIHQLEQEIKRDLLASNQVVCCTSIISGTLKEMYFPLVVVDEATQALETATLVSLIANCQHLILLGDHFQLPPTVLSETALKEGLGISLFLRLSQEEKIAPFVLDVQYRMHPMISQFPLAHFYRGKVRDDDSVSKRRIPNGIEWPNKQCPVVFYDIDSQERKTNHESVSNEKEASFIELLVMKLLVAGNPTSTIGVTTPYRNQLKLLVSKLDHLNGDRDRHSVEPASRMEIATIDGFQGKEKDIILFSTVRTDSVGFLNDWRRLNVALTRSRCGLIVVGNRRCLSASKDWLKWFEWLSEKGCLVRDDATVNSLTSQMEHLMRQYPQLLAPTHSSNTQASGCEKFSRHAHAIPAHFLHPPANLSSSTPTITTMHQPTTTLLNNASQNALRNSNEIVNNIENGSPTKLSNSNSKLNRCENQFPTLNRSLNSSGSLQSLISQYNDYNFQRYLELTHPYSVQKIETTDPPVVNAKTKNEKPREERKTNATAERKLSAKERKLAAEQKDRIGSPKNAASKQASASSAKRENAKKATNAKETKSKKKCEKEESKKREKREEEKREQRKQEKKRKWQDKRDDVVTTKKVKPQEEESCDALANNTSLVSPQVSQFHQAASSAESDVPVVVEGEERNVEEIEEIEAEPNRLGTDCEIEEKKPNETQLTTHNNAVNSFDQLQHHFSEEEDFDIQSLDVVNVTQSFTETPEQQKPSVIELTIDEESEIEEVSNSHALENHTPIQAATMVVLPQSVIDDLDDLIDGVTDAREIANQEEIVSVDTNNPIAGNESEEELELNEVSLRQPVERAKEKERPSIEIVIEDVADEMQVEDDGEILAVRTCGSHESDRIESLDGFETDGIRSAGCFQENDSNNIADDEAEMDCILSYSTMPLESSHSTPKV